MKLNICILSFLLFYCGYSVAEVYKCNVDGKPIFTDQPCDGGRVEFKAMNVFSAVEKSDTKKINIEYSSSKWFLDYHGYKRALKTSRLYKVPMFVYFQADWCGYCNILEKELLNTRQGKDALINVVKVMITPDHGDKENALFDEFGGTGFPSVYIKQASGSVSKKQYLLKNKGKTSVAKSASYLKSIVGS